jgi:selT/selW/selH-like putative selenoprotein
LLARFTPRLASVELAPGYDGRFEVFVDGEKAYSKLETKRFPELSEVIEAVSSRLPQAVAAT